MEILQVWATMRESRYICICNVHSVVTASQDPGFGDVIKEADLATPDGMPLVWMLRCMGIATQPRISGADLMWQYCKQAAQCGGRIFLYGGTEQTLTLLSASLRRAFPTIVIAGRLSPPFRELTVAEDAAHVAQINASRAGVVFVGLGCPKQERWIAAHRGRVKSVMIGVGAAFDFHAGTIRRAPPWMQRTGLEWLFRLICEPRRLWKRYLVTNTIFVIGVVRQLLSRP